MGDPNITARVTFLRQLAGEEIVEFSTEDTISDELALFADLGGHFEEAKGLDGRRKKCQHPRHLSSDATIHPTVQRNVQDFEQHGHKKCKFNSSKHTLRKTKIYRTSSLGDDTQKCETESE